MVQYQSGRQRHFKSSVIRDTRHRFHLPRIYTYPGSPYHSLWFAACAEPSCCPFSSAHKRMLRYSARSNSDEFLCSLRSCHWLWWYSHLEQWTVSYIICELVYHSALYLPSLNVKARRIPRREVSLLPDGRMLKSQRSDMYPGCKAHAPYCRLCPVGFYHIFSHYLINSTIFGKQLWNIKMCVLIFPVTLKHFLF
jgi:hypothetical protein